MMAASFFLLLLFVLNRADGSYIVGGRDAVPHSRPYMASLQFRGRHNCGGALVSRLKGNLKCAVHSEESITDHDVAADGKWRFMSYIQTPYTVVLGADSLTADETTKQQLSAVRSIPHPSYDGHANDIMLLKLNRRAQVTAAVQLISLKRDRLNSFSRCITAGWGDIGDNDTLANRLQEVNVTILPQRTCNRRWRGVPIFRTMVCGTGARSFQGFCSGDSGGPLICDGAAAGVVSFSGRRCGDPRTPDVYTRISSFSDWITSVLNSN